VVLENREILLFLVAGKCWKTVLASLYESCLLGRSPQNAGQCWDGSLQFYCTVFLWYYCVVY